MIALNRLGVGERRCKVEATVGIDGDVSALTNDIDHRLDARKIRCKIGPADLHLHDLVALRAIPQHLPA